MASGKVRKIYQIVLYMCKQENAKVQEIINTKALVLKQHGTLKGVTYADCPLPEIGPYDVQVETKAAALNRLDL